MGFGIRIVERAGAPLKNSFSVVSLWDSVKWWERLLLCEQGAEKLHPCFKASVVYENICQTCNPGTETDKEQVEIRSDIPRWEKRAVASMKEWWMTGEPRTKRNV